MNRPKGFSLIELLIVVAVILVVAAIAIPNLVRSRIRANEASASSTLRMLNNAEVIYAATYNSGYTDGLNKLGPPAAGQTPSFARADLVDPVLSGLSAAGSDTGFVKSGYIFAFSATGVFGAVSYYQIAADPQARGSSGQRSFFTDQPLVIRANPSGPASASDPPL
jgi:prepilin-type N-terminal cleavage/methylation domain-containing protein